MKLNVVCVEFCLELSRRQFAKLPEFHIVEGWLKHLDLVGLDWSGHYGPRIFFRVRQPIADSTAVAQKVLEILKEKLA